MLACFVVLSLIQPLQGGTEEAQKILDACKEKLAAARTVSGTLVSSMRMQSKPESEQKTTSTFRFQKPNLYLVDSDLQKVVSDGTTTYMYMPTNKQYMKLPVGNNDIPTSFAMGFEPFFGSKMRFEQTRVGMGSFKGQPAAEVVYKIPSSNVSLSVYVGKESHLPLGYYVKTSQMTNAAWYTDIKLDETFAEDVFKWTPPADASDMSVSRGEDSYEKNLLKIGVQAPDFTIKTTKDADLNLTRSLKGSKGMLVNFWFYG